MKLIIAGSRNIHDLEVVETAVFNFLETWYCLAPSDIDEIVSGTARGVDTLGEEFAERYSIPVKRFPADWERYGKKAGLIRNSDMAYYGTHLVAVWDGKSRGTQHMFNTMRDRGKPVYIHLV